MFLTELSLCVWGSLRSIFRYVATQGKLLIKSKRHPLFTPVSVYELQKAPKGEKNPWNFSSYWEYESIITNKLYFITGFWGDIVVKEKYIVWYYVLSDCLAFEQVNRLLESLSLNVLTQAHKCSSVSYWAQWRFLELMWVGWFFWFPLSYHNIWTQNKNLYRWYI